MSLYLLFLSQNFYLLNVIKQRTKCVFFISREKEEDKFKERLPSPRPPSKEPQKKPPPISTLSNLPEEDENSIESKSTKSLPEEKLKAKK